MRKRVKTRKVISVSADGNILSRSIRIPVNTFSVKATKSPYNEEDRKQYRDFSKSIANRVAKFKQDKLDKDTLDKTLRRNSIKNVANMFDKLIEINKDE